MFPTFLGAAGRTFSVPKTGQPRGTVQRIGASILAVVFFCASVALFVASPFIRVQTLQYMRGIVGQVFGTLLLVLAVLTASGIMFVAFRLGQGVVRSFHR
jgi:hypothetical protein